MDLSNITTPREGFDALRVRVFRGAHRDADWLMGQLGVDAPGARTERWSDMFEVRDQSVVYPDMRQRLTLTLTVAACDNGLVALHALAAWRSIYGYHRSTALYVAELHGTEVTLTPIWQQSVPIPTRDHMDIHTGGVSASSYHHSVITSLRETRGRVCSMLWDGEEHRTVDPADLAPLARLAVERPPIF